MRMTKFMLKMAFPLFGIVMLGACSGGSGQSDASANQAETARSGVLTDAAAPAPAAAYASLTGVESKGERVFQQCMACHSIKEGENRVGPSLHGIIGRKAGQVAGFNYSTANKSSAKTWDEETIFAFLESPRTMIPGTKMAFAGLRDPQDRADLIAYLKTHD